MAASRTNEWGVPSHGSGFRSRRDSALKWWIMLALIASFAFHAFLIWTFQALDAPTKRRPIPDRVMPERIRMNPKLLKQQEAIREIPKDIAPMEKPDVAMFKPDLDAFDKMSTIPKNQQMDLSPSVKDIQNLVRQSPDQKPGHTQADSLATMLSAAPTTTATQEDVASAMAAMKSSVLSKPISSKQMILDRSPLSSADEKIGMDLLDGLGNGAGKTASGGAKVKGFSSLDDLLSGGGRVGGSTAPILMPTDLLFEFGSDQLADGARLSLMKLGFLIQKNPDSLFIIEGHTDTIGSDESNMGLSQRRANAVVAWLTNSLHLTPERIRAVGMGKSHPLVNPNGTPEQQGLNRRVEIKVRPRQ